MYRPRHLSKELDPRSGQDPRLRPDLFFPLEIPYRSLRESLQSETESLERESHLVGGDADGGRFPTSLGVALP